MESDLKLNSVQTFTRANIPFDNDDLEAGMSLEFVANLPWLDYKATGKNVNIKYYVTSVMEFAKWLIGYDNYAVKGDWGYKWNGSYWEQMPVKQVYNMIDVSIIVIADSLRLTNTKKRELQRDVKPYLIEQSREFDDSIKGDYIAFKNWTLNVKENNFFIPQRSMNIIDGFSFEPIANQEPTTWINYAKYMFGDNAKFLWAWFGYAFQAHMSWKQGAVFLLDPLGGTGKTHFITKITQAMFGERRVGAFKLKNLQGNNARFETARFVGKSLMVDDDATKVRFKEDDVFKAVTGGGLSPVERKGIDGSEYRITAKMVINVNEMPVFNNAGAITRRLHIIKTVAPVATADEIKRRNEWFPEERLQAEIPMLATYAIEMFQKAVEADWEVVGNIAADIVALDPFLQWMKVVEHGKWKAADLYDNYADYFDSLKIDKMIGDDYEPMSRTAFGRKVSNWAQKVRESSGNFYFI
jgi:hypothetical protein